MEVVTFTNENIKEDKTQNFLRLNAMLNKIECKLL